jgi:DNA-binding transcriptional MocR family regulator
VCRFLLQPGDTVLLDDPCFFNFVALLRAHRVRVVSAPMTPQGPDLAAFAEVVAREKPRLYITNSAVHNPTGATLSATHVHRVLKIAAEADMVIVEDDIFADFETEPSPRYATFDGLERVIRIGSLSKTASTAIAVVISPCAPIGWMLWPICESSPPIWVIRWARSYW